MPTPAAFPEPSGSNPQGKPEILPLPGVGDGALPGDPAPAALSSSPDIGSLLRGLRRRWLLAVTLSLILGALAAGAAWFLLTPKFTAFAQVRIASYVPKLTPGKENEQSAFGVYIRSQAALIRSRPVVQAALRKDEVKRLALENIYPEPASYIEEELKVEFQEASEFLTLTLPNAESHIAVTVLKAIVASYLDYIEYTEKQGRIQAVTELQKVYDESNANLKTKKANLKRLAADLGTVDKDTLNRQRDEILSKIRELRSERHPLRQELLRSQGTLESQEAQLKAMEDYKIDDADVDAVLEHNPSAKTLLTRVQIDKQLIDYYDRRSTDPKSEPARIRAVKDLEDIEPKLTKLREAARNEIKERGLARTRENFNLAKIQFQNSIRINQDALAKLDTEIKELSTQASKLTGGATDTEFLQSEIARLDKVLDEVGLRLEEQRMNLRAADRITLHQDAELQKRDAKKQILATAIVPLAVIFGVCMFVAYGDHKQRRVYTASEVASGLGIRVVGAVPELPNLERYLATPAGEPDLEGHPVLESIDAIRTVLLRNAQREGTRVVLLTSASAGEGKTTLAAHLASSLARAGRKTLLIDGDLRTPAVHQLFELSMQPGFSELLLGEVETPDAIQPTTLDHLSVITAGQWDREVLQALARDGLQGIFEKLREEYDFVLIDSHPVLAATDALLIGQRADAVILSVMRGVSQSPRVYAAAQRLTALGIRVLGAVVNGSDPEEAYGHAPGQVSAVA
jgi:capsular exopolysaccharide synthesis family protein